MIDDLTIQKIKEAANIVDVIGDFYELRKRGTEYECLCPFHDDRHIGSFKINQRKNIAKCFSCEWQGGPVDFLMAHERLNFADAIRWLGKKYSIEVEGSEKFHAKPSVPRKQQPPLPMLVLPNWMYEVKEKDVADNTLVKWLRSLPLDACQKARIDEALKAYHIGSAKNGMTIFWQIDEQQRVRTGKMMLYKPDGHRDKEASYGFDWIHSALYRDYRTGYSADKADVKPCLFGLHLIDKYHKDGVMQDVCIVESEKTALIMAILYGNTASRVWMACGGLGNINQEKLKPLLDRKCKVILYPDRDGVAAWRSRASALGIMTDATPVMQWWREGDGEKADIADILINRLQPKEYTTTEEAIEDMPAIKVLAKELDLTLASNEQQI